MTIVVKGSLIKKALLRKLTLTNETFVVLSFAECPLTFQPILTELEF